MKLFKPTNPEQQTSNLLSFFPEGKAFCWRGDPNSNMRKFIASLAVELKRAYDAMNDISEDYDILVTDELLSRWEPAVGIPDGCFTGTGGKAERRLHVLLKFAKMNVQTAPEMVELAVALGFTDTTIQPLQSNIFPPYNVPFIPSTSPESRYIIVVYATGAITNIPPYDVPFTPAADNTSLLKCILDVVKPANTQVIFGNFEPKPFEPTDLTDCDCWLDPEDLATITKSELNALEAITDKAIDNDGGQSDNALKPEWIAGAVNGKAAIRFNNGQSLSIAGSTINNIPNNDNTIFIVARQNTGGENDALLSFYNGTTPTLQIMYDDNSVLEGASYLEHPDNASANFEIIMARREGSTQFLSVGDGGEVSNELGGDASGTDNVYLGSFLETFGFLTGDIAQVIIYSRSLNETEIAKVRAFLNTEFAL
jgi:uncharacterized protein YmfQ (DUF2313 family)